eukprot:350277-Chlamydomonas_euryale.AAC.2
MQGPASTAGSFRSHVCRTLGFDFCILKHVWNGCMVAWPVWSGCMAAWLMWSSFMAVWRVWIGGMAACTLRCMPQQAVH